MQKFYTHTHTHTHTHTLLLSRFSCVRLLATPWTAAHQAPPSMGFSRLEYWSGLPLPSLTYIHMYTHMKAERRRIDAFEL